MASLPVPRRGGDEGDSAALDSDDVKALTGFGPDRALSERARWA